MDINQFKYQFKIIVIGTSNTGKSCLLHQFLENKFKINSNHTIGVEFGTQIINMQDFNIKLQIWDTAGQERFRSVARTYYRGAHCALIVYDITNIESFYSLANWIKDAQDLARIFIQRKDICILVVGNKNDLYDERQVDSMEANKFCLEQGVQFLETSAMTGDNVQQAFNTLVKNLLTKIENGQVLENEFLNPNLQKIIPLIQKKNSKCCYK